jgi:hypothetical protein
VIGVRVRAGARVAAEAHETLATVGKISIQPAGERHCQFGNCLARCPSRR